MTKLTLLSVAAALLGKAPTSDDDALAELNRLGEPLTELKAAREFRDVVAAEFDGEKDPVKLAAKVRELKASVKAANDAAAATKKAAIKTTVDATMKQYEKSLTVPLREMMVRGLTKELEDGVELEKTETLKALKSLGGTGITTQRATPDLGGANSDDDDKLEARARELMTSDAEVLELTKRDRQEGYKLALRKADRELMAAAK